MVKDREASRCATAKRAEPRRLANASCGQPDVWPVPSSARRGPPQKGRFMVLLGCKSKAESIAEEEGETNGPPSASVARRAQSYSDFYHVVRAQLHKDQHSKRRRSLQREQLIERDDSPLDDPDEELLDASHDRYQLYHDQLRQARHHLDSLLDDTDANLELLSALSSSFNAVETQTSAFRARCETLLADQKRLSVIADEVSQNLRYYNYLDPITRRLNAPGAGHFVRSDEFKEMLSNLDHCLEYMETHGTQKEASTYQSRYRLLLTRGLTLIRVNFTNTVREVSADVAKRIADRQLNDTTMPALLYAKFRVGAPELRELALEIQKRASPPADAEPGTEGEYQSLMNELYQSYSAARGRLIVPIVRRKMAEIDVSAKDLITYVRTAVSYFRGLCLDEFELWHEWFEGDGGLYEFLEAMCEPLYDYLRPRTIRETQLPKLCEVCSLVQMRYMEDSDDDNDDDESEQAFNPLDFGRLIKPALEDAQTRLVFLALSVLRDEIERFKPKAEDLDYPARNQGVARKNGPALSGRKSSLPGNMPKAPTIVEEVDVDGMDLKIRYDSDTTYQGWYPTLRKAIWLLSRIYRLVNSSVFDDLAHQIVHQTTLSLANAAKQIAVKGTATDSQLFLLKQLLILKQQIVAFDIEFVQPEMNLDFSSITSTFWELRERGGLFNAVYNAGRLMPRVVENMLDAKAELDSRLRAVITEFVNGLAATMTAAVAGTAKKDASVAVQAVRTAIERDVPVLRRKLDEYLEDVRTKETLVGAVQDQALANYEDWFVKTVGSSNGVSKKGKSREDDVWDPDTFADWTAELFGVGRAVYDDEDDEDAESSPALSRSGSM
ncbi:hypothetical protein FH972_024395 [Carpinus fangiana]|uniref:Conserved oligomeric Golgi complex subunit 3 n=1 Tax=Carpinus fangiana TaxID=176857 RepID=A0A5N6KYU1_9ROSI|nr:hypothetical protein FH972_024395 [Carpinus fangiana]